MRGWLGRLLGVGVVRVVRSWFYLTVFDIGVVLLYSVFVAGGVCFPLLSKPFWGSAPFTVF